MIAKDLELAMKALGLEVKKEDVEQILEDAMDPESRTIEKEAFILQMQ